MDDETLKALQEDVKNHKEKLAEGDKTMALMAQTMTGIKENTTKTLEILQGSGDGEKGLVTKVALLKSSLKRSWIWLGTLSGGIIGLAFWILRKEL